MATHITKPGEAVRMYLQGVNRPQLRIAILLKDWDDWEGAGRQILGSIRASVGDYRDGEHSISAETVGEALKDRADMDEVEKFTEQIT